MNTSNAYPQYQAIQELIHSERIERSVALADAIGEACAAAWRAIASIGQAGPGERA